MQEFLPIVASVIGVFLVIGVGAFCRHRDWLTREADRSLANLTTNVLLPAYFIEKILEGPQYQSLHDAWQAPAFGFVVTSGGLLLSLLFARVLGPWLGMRTDSSQRAFALCVGVCNYGFIPLPLAEKFYPDSVIDLIIHNVGVNLALWSVGIAIISGSARGGLRKALLSPPFLSVVIALVLRYTPLGEHLPSPALTAIQACGACAIPMGLILSGAIIVDFLRDSSWLGSPGILISSLALRHAFFPVCVLSLASLAGSTGLREVLMLQAAMPAAILPIVLVRLYDRDTETALRVVLASSVVGVVTIPAWLAIGKWWLGI